MRTVAAGAVLLLAAVTGCSAGEAAPAEVEPLASGSASASATVPPVEAGATPRIPERGSTATSSAVVPLGARAETSEAATAFTTYFFEQVNDAYLTGDPDAVEALSHPGCNSCKSIIEDLQRLDAAGLQVDGRRFVMDFVETAPLEPDQVIVDYRFDADPYVERGKDGVVVREIAPRADVVGQARLIRDESGWLMYGLRLVD